MKSQRHPLSSFSVPSVFGSLGSSWRPWCLGASILLLLGIVTLQAQEPAGRVPPWQVFNPQRLPNDIRLKKLHDLDHPAPFVPQYKTKEEWETRKQALRTQLLVALGLYPMPKRHPVAATVHGKIERDGYTIEKVFFESLPGHLVCGNLYRPSTPTAEASGSPKHAGILMPHGHHANGRFNEASDKEVERELNSGAEQTKESAKYPLQARCAQLARLGCVVFHFDMVGYADSRAIAHRAGFTDVKCEGMGLSAMGLQTINSLYALDFLCGLPDVDPARIGVTGASGGGTQTFILCAIDERPAAACPAVMVSANMQGGCICENCSHLRVGTNNVEIAALFAPKPLFMPCAQDWTHDLEKRGLPELKRIFALYDAEQNVAAKLYPFPHNYNQVSAEAIYAWFNQHLKLGAKEPIHEQPFVPVPPKELSVFDASHPRPKEATAEELREAWRSWLNQAPPAEGDLRAALRVLIHDDLPAAGTTVATKHDVANGEGYYVWKGTQSRKAGGEEIPLIALVPPQSRTAVVWVHPDGKRSLFGNDQKPVPAVKKLLDAGCSVIAPDVFLTGEYHLPGQKTPVPKVKQVHHRDLPFIGFHTGYNRTLIAQRVSDLLTVIAHLRQRRDVDRLFVIGQGEGGLWALLASGLAGKAVDRAMLDLGGFDCSEVRDLDDERLLPGALRYGGAAGFATLLPANSVWKERRTAEELVDVLLASVAR